MAHRVTPGNWCWTFKCLGCGKRYYQINPDKFHERKKAHMEACRYSVVSRLVAR